MSPGWLYGRSAPAAQNAWYVAHGLQESYVGRQINVNGPRQTWPTVTRCIFLSLNSIAFNRFRTFLHVMRSLNFLISYPSSDLCTGSRLMNSLNLLSLTYKFLTTSQPDYLHNLISVQSTGRTRSSSSSAVTLPPLSVSSSTHYKSPTALLDMYHQYPWNQLYTFFIPSTSPEPGREWTEWGWRAVQSPSSLSPSVTFTPDFKPICSTNPFLRSLSGSIWTAFTEFGLWLDMLCSAPAQLLVPVRLSVSYRIVTEQAVCHVFVN